MKQVSAHIHPSKDRLPNDLTLSLTGANLSVAGRETTPPGLAWPIRTSTATDIRMPQKPESRMRRDQTFRISPPVATRSLRRARQHHFQDAQESLGDLKVPLVARLMKRDQDLIRQASGVARRGNGWRPTIDAEISFAHAGNYEQLGVTIAFPRPIADAGAAMDRRGRLTTRAARTYFAL
jgi:hypothetical protein